MTALDELRRRHRDPAALLVAWARELAWIMRAERFDELCTARRRYWLERAERAARSHGLLRHGNRLQTHCRAVA